MLQLRTTVPLAFKEKFSQDTKLQKVFVVLYMNLQTF